MSLVGPRPIRPRFFEERAAELPAYWQRLVVRPGLTGFAQVRRGYETSMVEKLAHDMEWIADRSVRLYLARSGRPAGACFVSHSASRRESSRSRSRWTRCITSSLIRPRFRCVHRAALRVEELAAETLVGERALLDLAVVRLVEPGPEAVAAEAVEATDALGRVGPHPPFLHELVEARLPASAAWMRAFASSRISVVFLQPEQADDRERAGPARRDSRQYDAKRQENHERAIGKLRRNPCSAESRAPLPGSHLLSCPPRP